MQDLYNIYEKRTTYNEMSLIQYMKRALYKMSSDVNYIETSNSVVYNMKRALQTMKQASYNK